MLEDNLRVQPALNVWFYCNQNSSPGEFSSRGLGPMSDYVNDSSVGFAIIKTKPRPAEAIFRVKRRKVMAEPRGTAFKLGLEAAADLNATRTHL